MTGIFFLLPQNIAVCVQLFQCFFSSYFLKDKTLVEKRKLLEKQPLSIKLLLKKLKFTWTLFFGTGTRITLFHLSFSLPSPLKEEKGRKDSNQTNLLP